MTTMKLQSGVFCYILVFLAINGVFCKHYKRVGDQKIVYEFVTADYDWPSEAIREENIQNGGYVAKNNILVGQKWYNDEVYIAVGRFFKGVPSTLNKVIHKKGQNLLQPFPSWEMNELGNCDSIQWACSMEIDPRSGEMWIMDGGRTNIFGISDNTCPPKLLIWDINKGREIRRHVFPNNVVSHTKNFLNDIVIDNLNKFAYMSDISGNGSLVVYDYHNDQSHRLEHPSMRIEPDAINIFINNKKNTVSSAVNGIALSADRTKLFYSAISSFKLYQLPTEIAKQPGACLEGKVRLVGRKVSQSDGMAFGQCNLYYGALNQNAVYKWEVCKDMAYQNAPIGAVKMATQTELAKDDEKMQWADSYSFDNKGYLWVLANKWLANNRAFTGENKPHFTIWKVFVNEKSYLA